MIYCDKDFIANKIKTARKNANLIQSELAEKIGISEKHLSKIETGKNFPALDNFLKIAEVLNLTLEDFGVKTNKPLSQETEALLKIILSASDDEIKAYLSVIQNINSMVKSKK